MPSWRGQHRHCCRHGGDIADIIAAAAASSCQWWCRQFHCGIAGWCCQRHRGVIVVTVVSSMPLQRRGCIVDSVVAVVVMLPKPSRLQRRRCVVVTVVSMMPSRHCGGGDIVDAIASASSCHQWNRRDGYDGTRGEGDMWEGVCGQVRGERCEQGGDSVKGHDLDIKSGY